MMVSKALLNANNSMNNIVKFKHTEKFKVNQVKSLVLYFFLNANMFVYLFNFRFGNELMLFVCYSVFFQSNTQQYLSFLQKE